MANGTGARSGRALDFTPMHPSKMPAAARPLPLPVRHAAALLLAASFAAPAAAQSDASAQAGQPPQTVAVPDPAAAASATEAQLRTDDVPPEPAPSATADESAVASDDPASAQTQAERDYEALYGNGSYNPVADPTLPAPAQVGGAYDPWERYNRRMHRINNAVDESVARPLARAYVAAVPRPVRLGVSNFFNNLGQPVSAINALLQGKPGQAAHALGRFALNTTLGIGGVFDPASDAKLDNRSEDFGQTLGVWGWRRSRYVELPLFGPRTLRDVVGMAGDAPLSPLRQVEADKLRMPMQGVQLVDIRAQLLSTDGLREGAEDDYALVRDAWSQRRDYQIFGDRSEASGDELPDYLRDDLMPTVPVDAMPVMPPDGL